MRRILLFTITVLAAINFLPFATVQTQQPEKAKRPNLADYPEAEANCKNKEQLAPGLTFPSAGPGKYICRLSVYNCKTGKTDVYESDPQDNCTDYYGDKEALQKIVFCCDKKCEDAKACPAIGQALEDVRRARTSVGAGSVRFNTLKSELNPILDQIEKIICLDNQGARAVIRATRLAINGREPSGSDIPLRLENIEKDLTRLQKGLCAAATALPNSCKPPEDGRKPYEDLARGDGEESWPDTSTTGHDFVPVRPGEEVFAQPEGDATKFMPLQPCPGCRWQLLAILNRNIGSRIKPVGQTRTVWHCPSSGATVIKNDLSR